MKNKQPKLPANLRGKFVSRASFAKMQGEKQRLERDIYTLVMSDNLVKIIFLKEQYRKKYEKNKMFVDALREIARKELPKYKNVQKPPSDLCDPKIDSTKGSFK